MAATIIVSKKIAHEHAGSYYQAGACYYGAWYEAVCSQSAWAHGHYSTNLIGSNCPICGSLLVSGGPYYACQCNSASCGTVRVKTENGKVWASFITAENDTGLYNLKYKWMKNGRVVSTASEFNPTENGDYNLIYNATDAKTGASKSVNLSFKITDVSQFSDVYVGDLKVYGMAVGDNLVKGMAVGDVIIK